MKMIATTLFAMCTVLAALVAPTVATPAPTARDVWAPTVLYPHAGTTWYRGQVSTPSVHLAISDN
jgi:hypothetical protein